MRREERGLNLLLPVSLSLYLGTCFVSAELAELLNLSQKLNPGFVHACEACNKETDRKEQLSGGMCEGGWGPKRPADCERSMNHIFNAYLPLSYSSQYMTDRLLWTACFRVIFTVFLHQLIIHIRAIYVSQMN